LKKNELPAWILANALGLGVGFLAVLQTTMLIETGFDWDMHWKWVEEAPDQGALIYVSTLVAMLVGGAVLGSAQALLVRSRGVQVIRWTLAAVAGFGVITAVIDWPLIALGLLGIIPGPVEPFIITFGGSSLAGIFQYLSLRNEGIAAGPWLKLWIMGLFVGVMATAIFFAATSGFLDIEFSWPAETFFSGVIVGGVAALFSGKALFAVLSTRSGITASA